MRSVFGDERSLASPGKRSSGVGVAGYIVALCIPKSVSLYYTYTIVRSSGPRAEGQWGPTRWFDGSVGSSNSGIEVAQNEFGGARWSRRS